MIYPGIDENKASDEVNRLNGLFDKFLISNGINNLTFLVRTIDLLIIITKVDQRKHYFKVFHNIDMSELKEVSLICYWLIRFKPYYEKSDSSSINDSLNEKFCVYLIIHAIRCILQSKSLDESPIDKLSKEYIYELTYTFKFRDISKEAMITIVETIAIMSGINPYHDFDISDYISESEIE